MAITRGEESKTFGNALSELKRRGCNLLLTGTLPGRLLTQVSAEMLGRPPKLRARVFALLGREVAAVRERLRVAGGSLEPAIVIDTVEHPRTAVAQRRMPLDESGMDVRRIERDLPVLEGAIREAVSEVRTAHYPLESGELRLCVDSLWSVADGNDVEEVRSFLTAVGDDVRAVDGMAHYVLPEDPDDETVAALEPCFDAIVEHRGAGDGFEQRWRLPDYDVETGWMRV